MFANAGLNFKSSIPGSYRDFVWVMVMMFLQLPSSKVQNLLLLLTLITSFDAGYLNGMLD